MGTLADELGTYRADMSRVIYVVRELLAELAALHAAGRCHPALTPANIAIVDERPQLANLDAPVARDAPYAAPETIRDGTLAIASNLYSAAAILQALLAGRQLVIGAWLDPDPARRPPSATAMLEVFTMAVWVAREASRVAPRVCAYVGTEPTERELLETLRANPRDQATRDVYADWLEGRGDTARASWLRGASRAAGEPAWRAILARGAVTHCGRDDCPRSWDAFAPTAVDNLRTCTVCDEPIGYCASEREAELFGARQHFRFAVDDALEPTAMLAAFRRAVVPTRTWNPPPPPLPLPANPPQPDTSLGDDTTVLGRFFGWFRRKR